MNAEINPTEARGEREVHYYPTCWCAFPGSRAFAGVFWGSLLVILGGAWLLNNLELLSPVLRQALWPLVVVGIGLASIGWALYERR